MAKVYLITGATRGLGKAFLEKYLARPDVIVIAAVRDPSADSAKALESLPTGSGSKLVLVKIDSTSATDPFEAAKTIEAAGISHLDVVIANAGISDDFSSVTGVDVENFRRHMDVNGYGTLFLIKALYPLLSKSTEPKFTALGSALGSVGGMEQRAKMPSAAYGPSKAVVHWLVRKLHFENENLVSFCVDPGFVQTDMGFFGAKRFGIEKPPVSVEDCVSGMISVIDSATREKTGGKNMVWNGSEFPW